MSEELDRVKLAANKIKSDITDVEAEMSEKQPKEPEAMDVTDQPKEVKRTKAAAPVASPFQNKPQAATKLVASKEFLPKLEAIYKTKAELAAGGSGTKAKQRAPMTHEKRDSNATSSSSSSSSSNFTGSSSSDLDLARYERVSRITMQLFVQLSTAATRCQDNA